MSVYISADVWKYSKTRGSARLLLLALADNAREETRIAIVGTAYLAEKTRLSQRAVHRLIQELEASGEVMVERNRGRHRTNRYRITEYTAEENVSDCQVFQDDPNGDDEFGGTLNSDKSCAENLTEITENLTEDAENVTTQKRVTVSNRSEPLLEPLVIPTWFKVLQEIDNFKCGFEHAEAWRLESGVSETIATDIAYELAAHPYATDKKRVTWRVFQNWCRRKVSDNLDTAFRSNTQGAPQNKSASNGRIDMTAFANEIEQRTAGGVEK